MTVKEAVGLYRVVYYDAADQLHDIKADLSLEAALRDLRAWFENRPTPWDDGSLTAKIEEHP